MRLCQKNLNSFHTIDFKVLPNGNTFFCLILDMICLSATALFEYDVRFAGLDTWIAASCAGRYCNA